MAAGQTTAGLQKWAFNGSSWQLAYTVRAGLSLGVRYTVPGYPTVDNPATGLPWSPATDGLHNLTGQVNPDGSVTIWAITSTLSGGDRKPGHPASVKVVSAGQEGYGSGDPIRTWLPAGSRNPQSRTP